MDNVFKLHILTPHSDFFDNYVTVLKTEDSQGPLEILPNYMPVVTVVKPCLTEFTGEDGQSYRALLSGGIMKINHNNVTMLCQTAEWK